MDPQILSKSMENRSEIDILYKSRFNIVLRSIFDQFFDKQSKSQTHKMSKHDFWFNFWSDFGSILGPSWEQISGACDMKGMMLPTYTY